MTNLISVKIMQLSAKIMQERAASVCEAVRKEAAEYKMPLMAMGAAKCRYDIRALPAPTDSEVLAAAMDLPQIKALKLIRDELDNLLDAITADDKFGDRSLTITGPTSNLKWLIEAQDDARAALAAYAKLGDTVTVKSCNGNNCVDVVNDATGEEAYFALTCGAQRLEVSE